MTWPRTAAYLSLACFLAMAGFGIQTGLRLWDEHSRANREAALKWATEQAALTRKELIHALDARLGSIEHQAVAEIRQTRKEAVAEIAATRDRLDDRLVDIQQDATGELRMTREAADRRLGELTASIEQGRKDAKPVLEQTAALELDAKESWDDIYWDVKALVESATVASHGMGETALAVGKHAEPQQAALTGIAQDVHTFTSKFVAPKTKKQKAWEVLKLGVYGIVKVVGG